MTCGPPLVIFDLQSATCDVASNQPIHLSRDSNAPGPEPRGVGSLREIRADGAYFESIFTLMDFGFDSSRLGSESFMTPSLNLALIFSTSTEFGSVNVRSNTP